MHRYSIGTPVVSAIIRTKTAGEVTAVAVAKGDALTDLTVVSYPENIVLPSATVRGFTLKSLSMPRNSSTVYDGIPTYMPDPDGGSYFGTAEEVTEIDKILVDVPAATEGCEPTVMTIPVSSIKSFSGGTPVEGETNDGAGDGDETV